MGQGGVRVAVAAAPAQRRAVQWVVGINTTMPPPPRDRHAGTHRLRVFGHADAFRIASTDVKLVARIVVALAAVVAASFGHCRSGVVW